MCGIAGMIDLSGQRHAPRGIVPAMAKAIYHRGPDEDGFLDRDGLHLANTRLSIVGLADGRQPISNEDGSVWTVFNGEFFDYPEKRQALQSKGHQFRTHTDTEILPHLWEDHREKLFDYLKGQYAVCVWDSKTNEVVLGRDRTGICPLFFTTVKHDGTDWLLFASEIKAILASGLVTAKPDLRGLNHIFTFFAMPGPMTVFEGIQVLLPGRYLHLKLGQTSVAEATKQRIYWQINYPDWGQEDYGRDEKKTIDAFEDVLLAAVQRRLRADVPVVSYLSGGVDSSLVVAMANKALGRPIPTFTISVKGEGLNEESEALQVAKALGCEPIVVPCGPAELRADYPELIAAAECPVIDTSCLGLMHLARTVHQNGFKVALTGEGADEWMAGYSWFKIHKMLGYTDIIPGLAVRLRRLGAKLAGQPMFPMDQIRRTHAVTGGHNGWLDCYGLMSLNKIRFFGGELREKMLNHSAFEDLELSPDLHRWNPFNRQMSIGARVMLPGHLMASKGDRVAMHSSVEARYPFLDEDVLAFLATLHPRWKLRRLTDKYIERKVAEKWLPPEVAWRKKHMFRAPMDSFAAGGGLEPWIAQVMSRESMAKTGYFDYDAVHRESAKLATMKRGFARTGLEMGLTAVTATQLWHHLYISGDLCDLPRVN
ncbi:asparagine synthase (glutamine-hydrolyzing) [Limnoglobus roseus]|uniref:asparagine synthase (glutamine-hydrolyzing) n=1 Tax=Limnoglobus roseus TaxID=2598579 RepID=A0A5C1AL41_9BACT|nr:asparagine synthase (glutamine-hydrolyzing) [Limnoglobus roseus]QEL20109.1 asparagine synthase (glutamine-hydrolyzing) [Limnoglobus roseus]